MSYQLLAYRFPKELLSTKPGPKGRTLTYVDVRVIASVLDVLTPGWVSSISLNHNGSEYAAVCSLTVDGITRDDVGSGETPPDASNQAFRRAAAAHGLGRYLWIGEVEPVKLIAAIEPWQSWKQVSDLYAWAIEAGVVRCEAHGRNALKLVVDELGGHLTERNWSEVCERFYQNRLQRLSEKSEA